MILNPNLETFPRKAHQRFQHGRYVMVRATNVKKRRVERRLSLINNILAIGFYSLIIWLTFKAKSQAELEFLLLEAKKIRD